MCGGRAVALVTDARLDPGLPPLRQLLAGVAVAGHLRREPGSSDWDYLAATRAFMDAHRHAAPAAVGGGSVLDGARLAVMAGQVGVGRGPAVWDRLAGVLAGGGGMFALPGPPGASADVVCVPTTTGTAAEVSPIAVVRAGTAVALVVGPGLRARAAILDPQMTAGLSPAAAVVGLLEPFARAVVPAVCGSELPLQDNLARAIAGTVVALAEARAALPAAAGQGGDGPEHQRWRLAAAEVSAQTHTSFLALGRSPFGARLWPVATECAGVGLPKATVMAWLLPTWLRGVAGAALGPAWGSPARAAAIMGQPPAVMAARITDWLHAAGLTPPPATWDPTEVAGAVMARWPMFLGPQAGSAGGVRPAEVAWLAANLGTSQPC
jgi:hypothetical protein